MVLLTKDKEDQKTAESNDKVGMEEQKGGSIADVMEPSDDVDSGVEEDPAEAVASSRSVGQEREFTDETIELLVDDFLFACDKNDDGYVECVEFGKGRED